jgi:lysyl-tRNA synthetase class 2
MSTDDSDQVVQRRANLQELKDLGVDPYPRRFEGGIPIAPLVAEHGHKTAQELEGTRITIRTAGRILAIRGFGKAGFLQLSDGQARVQVYVRQDAVSEHEYKIFKLLDLGDWVGVEGICSGPGPTSSAFTSRRWRSCRSACCHCRRSGTVCRTSRSRYRQRYLDLIVNPDSRRCSRVRSRVVTAIRDS